MSALSISKKAVVGQWFLQMLFVLFFTILCVACRSADDGNTAGLERTLWSSPDSCLMLADKLLAETINRHDSITIALYREHALLRKNHELTSKQQIEKWGEEMDSRFHDNRLAAMAYYMIGTDAHLHGDEYSASYALKYAEELLLGMGECDSLLLGLTYYRLGNAAAGERLYEFAHNYYMQAISWLRNTHNTLYLACAYRDAAYTQPYEDRDGLEALLDSAQYYASQLSDPVFLAELQYTMLSLKGEDAEALHSYELYLCDSLGLSEHAAALSSYYIDGADFQNAKTYLQVLAADTMYSVWQLEQYYYQYARYLSMVGNKDSAITLLQHLHLWQTEQIENDAYTRTFAIAQQFDVLKEQNKILSMRVERSRLYRGIISLVVLLLVVLLLGLFVYSRNNIQYQKTTYEKQMAQQRLKIYLRSRLQQAKNFNKTLLTNHVDSIPNWAKDYYKTFSLTDKDWEQVIETFNLTSSLPIAQLKADYPEITRGDIILIILIACDFSVEDCCILLDTSKEAVWKRRKRIKQRLTLPQNIGLDDWVKNLQS